MMKISFACLASLACLPFTLLACGGSDGGSAGTNDPTTVASDLSRPALVDDTSLSIVLTRAGSAKSGAEVCAPGSSSFQLDYDQAHYTSNICQFGGTADIGGDEPLDSAALAPLLTQVKSSLRAASATPCADGEVADTADVIGPSGTTHYVSCGESNVASGISESIAEALKVSLYGVPQPGVYN